MPEKLKVSPHKLAIGKTRVVIGQLWWCFATEPHQQHLPEAPSPAERNSPAKGKFKSPQQALVTVRPTKQVKEGKNIIRFPLCLSP